MKANELMIGNYLMELTSNDIFQVSESYYQALNVNLECSRPIPLTEQWLLDFGFEYELGNCWQNWTRISLQKVGVCYLVDFDNVTMIGINYVHQLQNLYFSLTGNHL